MNWCASMGPKEIMGHFTDFIHGVKITIAMWELYGFWANIRAVKEFKYRVVRLCVLMDPEQLLWYKSKQYHFSELVLLCGFWEGVCKLKVKTRRTTERGQKIEMHLQWEVGRGRLEYWHRDGFLKCLRRDNNCVLAVCYRNLMWHKKKTISWTLAWVSPHLRPT